MSYPEYNLILTEQAQLDYEDILLYTLQNWGEQQYSVYAALLDQALLTLQENSVIGYHPRQLPTSYKALHVSRHLIIYRVEDKTIIVLRVLHDKMDLSRHI